MLLVPSVRQNRKRTPGLLRAGSEVGPAGSFQYFVAAFMKVIPMLVVVRAEFMFLSSVGPSAGPNKGAN